MQAEHRGAWPVCPGDPVPDPPTGDLNVPLNGCRTAHGRHLHLRRDRDRGQAPARHMSLLSHRSDAVDAGVRKEREYRGEAQSCESSCRGTVMRLAGRPWVFLSCRPRWKIFPSFGQLNRACRQSASKAAGGMAWSSRPRPAADRHSGDQRPSRDEGELPGSAAGYARRRRAGQPSGRTAGGGRAAGRGLPDHVQRRRRVALTSIAGRDWERPRSSR